MLRLGFDKGTLLLNGEVGTPYGKWDLEWTATESKHIITETF